MSADVTTNSAGVTVDEVFESLTGFEEIALDKHFGDDWVLNMRRRPAMFLRALAFVLYKRKGQDDRAAKNAAMALTARQANDMFATDPAGDDPEFSESGKDSETPE